MPLDRQELAAARRKLAGIDQELVGLERELATTSATLQRMERTGAGRGAQRELAGALRELTSRRKELLRGRLRASALVDRIREGVRVPRTFEQAIGDLDGSVPVAMLPVRLETRFMKGSSELWVRVFPDTVHQHSFEPELTDAELAAATDYWTTRWKGTSDEARAVWEQMARTFRPTRARWVVDATTPTNLADIGTGEPRLPDVGLKAAPWTRPAVARQLPERWVVLGYRKGKEVARVWGQRIVDDLQMGPTPDITAADDAAHPLHEPPDEQDTQAFDEGLRWMADVDAALAAGMAVKLVDRDVDGGVAAGFDLLVVVGVDWTLDPAEAAASLGAHLTSHGYTDGLTYTPVGTPTNVTDDAAPPSGALGDPSLLDPAVTRSPADDAAGPAFTAALGLGEVPLVSAAPGSEDRSDVAARHMNSALWAPTWGYFLEQMMRPHFTTGEVEQVRAHAVEHLRGRGPLPTVRIGRQPYGVLPIVASRPFTSSSAFENALAGLLGNLKRHWLDAADRVPNLVDADHPDEAMVTLLRMSPRSETFRFRQATGAAAASSFEGMGDVATFQELLARWLLATVDVRTRPAIVDVTMADETRVVPVPLAASTPSPTDPLDPNYISTILRRLRTVGGFLQIIGDPSKAGTLLDALIRQSAQLELARASYLLAVEAAVADQLIRPDTVPNIEDLVMPREREVHLTVDDGITVEVESAPTPESVVLREGETLLELTGRAVAGVSGRTTMANHLVQLPQPDLRRRFSTARFGDFRAALEHLAPLPSQVLDELAAETLDTTSHRLDAWFTSLASRRLAASRKASPGGVHIGGYGWVERLRPAGAPVSTGYIHAPSVGHATTAAVLRSGHLARRSGDDAFAVDLSSRRVSLALSILDGVRQGQPIGALLGYRFERGLRDRDITLAKYILDFRRVAPLATSTDGFDDGRPLEAVAARDVVDGATLAERAQSDVNALLTEVGVSSADRSRVSTELDALVDALDAVSDLLVGESVHQAVMGNSERSGAALDALDRQTAPPDVSVVRTPRTGVGVGHRVVLALADAPADGAWAGLVDARSDAEPRLNTWAAAAIGDPGLVRIAASGRRTAPDGTTTVTPISLTLADLGISAISTVLASVSGGSNRPSELHQRLADACFGLDPTAEELHFDEEAPAGSPASAIGLAELLEVCQQVYDLVASARPATTSDLLVPTERADDVADAAELARRADRAVAAVRRALGDLPAADAAESDDGLRSRLRAAADAGTRGAVPLATSTDGLRSQVEAARADAQQRLERIDSLGADFTRATASNAEQVRFDLSRLQTVFGEGFPVVPVLEPAGRPELATAMAQADTVVGGDPLVVTDWVQRYALVRPAMARLLDVLEHSEARGGALDATQFGVVQLSSRPTDRWVGLPVAEDSAFPASALSVVVHHTAPLDADAPLCGLVVDQWSDTVPNTTETTGLGFHFDAPGVRAPQAILLATPPDLDAAGWSLEALVSTVHEAIDLTHIRAVDADVLAGVGRFLPAGYLTFNLERKAPTFDVWGLLDLGLQLKNVRFAEGDG